jgi:hypothetical protein
MYFYHVQITILQQPLKVARVAQRLERRLKDLTILTSWNRSPLWDVGADLSDETCKPRSRVAASVAHNRTLTAT